MLSASQIVNPKLKQGFSLIKLLIIVVILGGVLTIALYLVSTTQAKNRDTRRKADLASLEKALSLAKAQSLNDMYYPSAITEATLVKYGFIEKIPTDPINKSPLVYTYMVTPAGCSTSICTGYILTACLENKNDPQKDTTDTCEGDSVSYTISSL